VLVTVEMLNNTLTTQLVGAVLLYDVVADPSVVSVRIAISDTWKYSSFP
jgi:hypothetical protein